MKNVILFSLFLLPILVASQRRPKIKGNRTVTEVTQALPAFNAIELSNDLDIELKKSLAEGFEVIADDNLVDVLKFEVIDSTLMISSLYDIISKKKLDIKVNYRELAAITVKDGKVFTDEIIATDELYLNTFGNAELDIDASGFMADLNAEDSSRINLNLDVDSLNVRMKQKANGLIYAVSGTEKVTLSDNASLTLEGSSEIFQVGMSSNSKLRADQLEAAEVYLTIAENGFARVNAFRMFQLASSGSSKTHLYGSPKITIEAFSDTSQLLKKQD